MKEKQIQISQKLFITLVKCFVLDMEVDCEEIKKELNRKLDAVDCDSYTVHIKQLQRMRRKRKHAKNISMQKECLRAFDGREIFSLSDI